LYTFLEIASLDSLLRISRFASIWSHPMNLTTRPSTKYYLNNLALRLFLLRLMTV